jgi:hypothetical protein
MLADQQVCGTPDVDVAHTRAFSSHIRIMTLDLTDDEAAARAAHLRHALEYDPFPYAPRLDPLKAILAKLEPPAPTPAPLPPLKSGIPPRRRRSRG